MARKKRDYAKFEPEVFMVGREQAMRLIHPGWEVDIFQYRCEYLVVACPVYFGDSVTKEAIREWGAFSCIEDAVNDIEEMHAADMRELSEKDDNDYWGLTCVWYYEVWHLVNDGELWDEWERKVETYREMLRYGHHYIGYHNGFGGDVGNAVELVAVLHEVERHVKILTDFERVCVSSYGFGYELHDMDYSCLRRSGTFYELTYLDGVTAHVNLFENYAMLRGWMARRDELLGRCPHFTFGYSYDSRGIYSFDSGSGEEPMVNLDALSLYLKLAGDSATFEV